MVLDDRGILANISTVADWQLSFVEKTFGVNPVLFGDSTGTTLDGMKPVLYRTVPYCYTAPESWECRLQSYKYSTVRHDGVLYRTVPYCCTALEPWKWHV